MTSELSKTGRDAGARDNAVANYASCNLKETIGYVYVSHFPDAPLDVTACFTALLASLHPGVPRPTKSAAPLPDGIPGLDPTSTDLVHEALLHRAVPLVPVMVGYLQNMGYSHDVNWVAVRLPLPLPRAHHV